MAQARLGRSCALPFGPFGRIWTISMTRIFDMTDHARLPWRFWAETTTELARG